MDAGEIVFLRHLDFRASFLCNPTLPILSAEEFPIPTSLLSGGMRLRPILPERPKTFRMAPAKGLS
ncbi:uncharacterized protein Dmul_11150 [Desulfococcus multivorans]|jgi:hypothetical protein|nr:uncharacterized protein Dmul_11150 [Desulfococcus multivorans]